MHLAGTSLPKHADNGALSVSAHDRIIDHHESLARDDLTQWIELETDTKLSDRLRGLDERTSDVGVLDQTLCEWDAGLLGVSDSCRGSALGHRNHQICIDRTLTCQLTSHLCPNSVNSVPGNSGVGASKVDELEQAALRLSGSEPLTAQAMFINRDQLTGLDLAHKRCTHDVQCCGFTGNHPAALKLAESQWPNPLRIARGIERGLIHEHQGVCPLHLGKFLHRSGLDRQVGM